LELRRKKLGNDHPDTLLSMYNLAVAYLVADRIDPALAHYLEAATGVERGGFRHESADLMVNHLVLFLEKLKQFDQAEACTGKWVGVVKERKGPDSLASASPLAGLGTNLIHQKKWAEAEAVLSESLAILLKQQPDGWLLISTQALLGAAILNQGRYADAEPLL